MERILYSIAVAAGMTIVAYLLLVFFMLTDKVVPLWILAALGVGNFILVLLVDVITASPPETPSRGPDEE